MKTDIMKAIKNKLQQYIKAIEKTAFITTLCVSSKNRSITTENNLCENEKIGKFEKTYIWYFDTNEGYGREQFICVAKDENEVLVLYDNPNKIEDCDKDVILNGYEKLSESHPLVFSNNKNKDISLNRQLILMKKIETYNTLNQIIYDTTS